MSAPMKQNERDLVEAVERAEQVYVGLRYAGISGGVAVLLAELERLRAIEEAMREALPELPKETLKFGTGDREKWDTHFPVLLSEAELEGINQLLDALEVLPR